MIYYFLIVFWVGANQMRLNKTNSFQKIQYPLIGTMFILMTTVSLAIPITTDMTRYLTLLNISRLQSLPDILSNTRFEPGYITYQWFISQISTSKNVFMILSMSIMWLIIIFSLKKMLVLTEIPMIMLGYISFFYFYNFSTNTLRQGIAAPLILLTIVYIGREEKKSGLFTFLVAISFHTTAIISLLIFIIKKFNISLKTLTIIYIISAGIMITGLNRILLMSVSGIVGGGMEETVGIYSSNSTISDYGATNRIDFLLFTTVWVLWGIGFRHFYLKENVWFEWILKAYIALSSIYLLFGFIAFSDRMAAYPWFLIPILLFYPSLNIESKFKNVWIVFCLMICVVLFFYFNVSDLYTPLNLFYYK
ncbi:EpsG family protein [Alkalibacterium sp. f15]|uniref:EpsG family protein n=1 Tax=Alkalibacterium sp. f15 TaxID=3414029 RepID=UPI003BF89E7F